AKICSIDFSVDMMDLLRLLKWVGVVAWLDCFHTFTLEDVDLEELTDLWIPIDNCLELVREGILMASSLNNKCTISNITSISQGEAM
ncbi:MAG: hypothetical protein ACFCU9_06975, partial [Cyanophyceae cyanobacterium]